MPQLAAACLLALTKPCFDHFKTSFTHLQHKMSVTHGMHIPPGALLGDGYLIFLIPFTSTFAAQNVTRGMHIPLALLGGRVFDFLIPITSTFTAQNVLGGIFLTC